MSLTTYINHENCKITRIEQEDYTETRELRDNSARVKCKCGHSILVHEQMMGTCWECANEIDPVFDTKIPCKRVDMVFEKNENINKSQPKSIVGDKIKSESL